MAISIATQTFGQPNPSFKGGYSPAVRKEAIRESTNAYGMILADIASFPKGWADPLQGFEQNVAKIENDFKTPMQARAVAVCMFAKGYHGQAITESSHSEAEVAIYKFAAAWKASGYKMDGDTMCAAGVTSECLAVLFTNGWASYR